MAYVKLNSASNALVGVKFYDFFYQKIAKTSHFGRIQAMSLPGRFKLDDSASNELVGVKFYDFFLIEKLKLSLAAN